MMALTFDCSTEAMESFDESPLPGGTGATTLVFPFGGESLPLSDSLPLMVAWCALLYRHYEQEDLAIAWLTWRSGEWHTSTLPLVLDGGLCPRDVAHQLEKLREASEHTATRVAARARFGFSCEPVASRQTANFPPAALLGADLHLACHLVGGEVHCRLTHSLALLDEEAAAAMLSQYRALVTGLPANMDTALRTLPLLSAGEAQFLLRAWTGPSLSRIARPVFQPIEMHAAHRPDAIAVALNDDTLTYAELNGKANRLAHWLLAQGVRTGAHVAVSMEPSLAFVVSMLAIFKAGATHVPLDPAYPAERLAVILDDTKPTLVLTEAALASKLSPLAARVVCVDTLEGQLAGCSAENPALEVDLDTIAYVVYTSGTTGKPKGVMVSHGSLAHYLAVAADAYRYDSSDVIAAMARFSFSITFFELLSPLVAGGRLMLLERGHVLDLARMTETLTALTCIHCSPSLWRKLIGHIDAQGLTSDHFANLRHVSSGGDMVPPDVLESLKRLFTRAEVYVIYGSSEISCMGCTYPVPRDRTLTSTRVGKPFPNMSLRILDAAGNLVPPGVLGEVCFGGAGLATGYLNAPELTATKFVSFQGERLYHMGDLGRVDADGNLELVGRRDFQIKLRGIRIEPADIEANLRTLAGVKDVIVAAPTMPDGEKRLVAYVVSDPSTGPSPRQMRDALKSRLPDYMVPSAFVLLDAMPVNVNNKVDRLKLQRLEVMPALVTGHEEPPRTERERALLAIWETVLGTKGIGIRDDFFDVGGDSLRAVTLMTEIDRQLGVVLPVSTVLSAPTIEGLAAVMDGEGSGHGTGGISKEAKSVNPTLVCLRKGTGQRPPVFFVHDGEGETIPYRNFALRLHPGHTVYGLHPKSDRHHPILHTRLPEIVAYYVAQIKSVQPVGPYILSGLCIGGFLAFEVGRKLQAMGDVVAPIGLIDVAHVTTPQKSMTSKRVGRFSKDLASLATEPLAARAVKLALLATRRARGMAEYEARSRYERRKIQFKIQLLRHLLDRGASLPAFLRDISVDSVLRFAEKEYVVPPPYRGEVLLFRATTRDPALEGIVDDTPYQDTFQDPMLGWQGKSTGLRVYDVPAGHSSSLREPAVSFVASRFQEHIDKMLIAALSAA